MYDNSDFFFLSLLRVCKFLVREISSRIRVSPAFVLEKETSSATNLSRKRVFVRGYAQRWTLHKMTHPTIFHEKFFMKKRSRDGV